MAELHSWQRQGFRQLSSPNLVAFYFGFWEAFRVSDVGRLPCECRHAARSQETVELYLLGSALGVPARLFFVLRSMDLAIS